MASIDASTSGAGGIITTADNTGTLNLQSGGTTIATINSTGLSMASGKVLAPTGPTFRASKNSTQSISASTWTKIQYNVEDWDTNSNYDNATNYRFTPTVAGYYQVDLAVEFNNVIGSYMVAIYKNGSDYIVNAFYAGSTIGSQPSSHGLIYMNGSTDYLEGYAYTTNTSQTLYNGDATYFNASLVRGA